ncbi:MAG: NlpC/P60 family protein, partial [Jatrophihabitantaceae bacterium]
MADRKFIGVRPITVAVAWLVAAALIIPAVASADPLASPAQTPSVSTVQQQLGELALQNAQLVERYDQAQTDVTNRQAAAVTAQKAANKIDATFQVARTQLASSAAAQYESGTFSSTGALLSSDSGQSYLNQLATLSMLSTHNAQVVTNVSAIKQQADAAQTTASNLLAAATAKRDALATQKAVVQKQIDKFRTLLSTLTAAQQQVVRQQMNPKVSTATVAQATTNFIATPGTAKSVAQAVRFALAQVGKPYVWGAAGPSTYDCSGLTMAAWASAGIS